jgi:dihydroflavonol-4-reductase
MKPERLGSDSSSATAEGSRQPTVLVTGGSGFVGGWAVVELLRRNYRVRTTVRDLAREPEVRAVIQTQTDPGHRLEFAQADLLDDHGWEEATAGAEFVLHVASPMPVGEFRGQDVITPARAGTLRVLRAARDAGVKRVVITSSAAAAIPTSKTAGVVADETVWTDLPPKAIHNYPRSKTLAEQDAWSYVREHGGIELTTVLPAQIQGPVLGGDLSPSVQIIAMMLTGKMPAVPRVGFGIVDIRDLVDLHIRAMTAPQAAGERFIATSDFLWLRQIAQVLKDELGEKAAKVRTRSMPDFVVRLGALVNAEMKQLTPNLGVHQEISAEKAARVLDWRPRPARSSIVDTADSLIDNNLV